MTVVSLLQERGKDRASKLRHIARQEEHGWSIPEVLRADADLIRELCSEIERLERELEDATRPASSCELSLP